MAAEAIIYYSVGKRDFLTQLFDKGIFGLSMTISNKDQAFFVASWGIGSPEAIKKRDPNGWIRSDYIKYAEEKALMSIPLLATASNDDEVGEYAEYGNYKNYFEKCIEKGFQVIKEKVEDVNWDNNLLERRVLNELDMLYAKYVEDDI